MVFSTFYQELSAYLLGIEVGGKQQVQHVDLWRELPDKPIKTPAVFIQLMHTPWASTGQNRQEGVAEVRLHILGKAEKPTKANDNPLFSTSLEHLQVVDLLYKKLTGWRCSVSGSMGRTASDTDRAPKQLFHSVETWRVKLIDASAVKTYVKAAPKMQVG